jgi:hypothetical protein
MCEGHRASIALGRFRALGVLPPGARRCMTSGAAIH